MRTVLSPVRPCFFSSSTTSLILHAGSGCASIPSTTSFQPYFAGFTPLAVSPYLRTESERTLFACDADALGETYTTSAPLPTSMVPSARTAWKFTDQRNASFFHLPASLARFRYAASASGFPDNPSDE